MSTATESCRIRTDGIMWKVIEGEALILNTTTGVYHSLNAVGTDIWCRLAEGLPLHNIIQFISQKYNVDMAIAKKDINEMFAELRKADLLA